MIYHIVQSCFEAGGFAVFKYITSRALISFVTAFFLTLVIGRPLIVFLYKKGFRSSERSYGDINSQSKKGTPMMGGIIIFITGIGSALLWCDLTNPFILVLFASALWFGFFGGIDDYLKIKNKNPDEGLSRSVKYFVQILFASALALLVLHPEISPLPLKIADSFQIPFYKGILFNSAIFTAVWIVFIIVYSANSVNFADGMDGLAIVPSIFVFIVIGVFSYIIGNAIHADHLLYHFIPGAGEITVFCGAIIGAGLGFLWFNTHPAEVFMGDMGSLFLGGTMGTAAILIRQEVIFIIAGAVFVVEITSTFVQENIGFKMYRRILQRAPLHHHYHHQGMAEAKIVSRFWIISAIMAALAVITIKFR
ncbi:MAG: phospho-N-acetylmuramoyl-pentapeptide-transferase [bacterium]